MLPEILMFEDTELEVVDREGLMWLRGKQVADALGYTKPDAVGQIYTRNADEFTEEMTCTLKLSEQGQIRDVRVFSLRGAHLLGMFARTERAKAFRRWVLDVLEGINEAPETSSPAMPASVSHRADHIVSATRSFNGLMRAGQALRLNHARAAHSANEATLRHTGFNLLQELGVSEEELAACEPATRRKLAAPANDDTLVKVSAWLNAPEQTDKDSFTTTDILMGALGIQPASPNYRGLQTTIGYVMQRLGFRRHRGHKHSRQWRYVRPED